jgi:hypothetical protein
MHQSRPERLKFLSLLVLPQVFIGDTLGLRSKQSPKKSNQSYLPRWRIVDRLTNEEDLTIQINCLTPMTDSWNFLLARWYHPEGC